MNVRQLGCVLRIRSTGTFVSTSSKGIREGRYSGPLKKTTTTAGMPIHNTSRCCVFFVMTPPGTRIRKSGIQDHMEPRPKDFELLSLSFLALHSLRSLSEHIPPMRTPAAGGPDLPLEERNSTPGLGIAEVFLYYYRRQAVRAREIGRGRLSQLRGPCLWVGTATLPRNPFLFE